MISRILESETFRRSAKLREFLTYVAERAFERDTDAITEQQIGVAVFRRAAGYNPGDDSVVRVQARHLRAKLAEHFAGEGAGEPLVVEIPKGGYVPSFRPRETPAPAPPESTANPTASAASAEARRSSRWAYLVVLLCLTTFALGVLVQRFWPSEEAASAPPSAEPLPASASGVEPAASPNPVLARVLSPDQPTMLFLEDMLLLVAYAFRNSNDFISLEAYREGSFRSDVASRLTGDMASQRLGAHIRIARHVDFANAQFAFSLARAYPRLCRNVTVRYPQDIHVRDLKVGNCIFLGGTTDNPWVELYEDRLNFRLRYFSVEGGGFENHEPRPGEPSVYGELQGGERTYYARIALLPNLDTDYNVLILTGLGSTATEAATEFILRPDSAGTLPSPLRAALESGAQRVEILLEVTRVMGAPARVEVAAWRADSGQL